MTFDEMLAQVLALLQREKRVSYRALKRRFDVDDTSLEDVKDELIYATKLAVDEENRVLVWTGDTASGQAVAPQQTPTTQPPAAQAQGRVPVACGSFGNLPNRVQYPHFSASTRGLCHGLPSLFFPIAADCSGVAVPHAPVGMAQRHRRVPDDTGAATTKAQA